MKDNEDIRILDVDGQPDASDADLHRTIFAMGLSSELSKSEKGLYHAQINPAVSESELMSDEDWLRASDMLGKELGLENQRRAIVLHSKKGRTHAHVVWERFDHGNQRMVSDSFSRLAQDRARKEMEKVFGHEPTPHRNKHRPELKASLSKLWKQSDTGAQFIKAASNNGYIISEGSGRSPYMVVDTNGRSYSLSRQLQGVRLKEIRQRLRGESLLNEKDAITLARKTANDNNDTSGRSSQSAGGKQQFSFPSQTNSPMSENKSSETGKNTETQQSTASTRNQFSNNQQDITEGKSGGDKAKSQFAANSNDVTGGPKAQQPEEKGADQQFAANRQSVTGQEPGKRINREFAENKGDTTKGKDGDSKDADKRKQEAKQRMQAMKEKNDKQKGKGPEID